MAYSTSNPPALLTHGIVSGSQPRIWVLTGTDATTVVDTAGYISNASALGMRAGDLVMYLNTSTFAIQLMVVMSVVAGGSANLSDGTAIAITNTD